MTGIRLVPLSIVVAWAVGLVPMLTGSAQAACSVVGTGTQSALDSGDTVTCLGTVNGSLQTNMGQSNVTANIGDGSTASSLNASAAIGVALDAATNSTVTVYDQATVASDNESIRISGGSSNFVFVNDGAAVGVTSNGAVAISIGASTGNTITIGGVVGDLSTGTAGIGMTTGAADNLVTILSTGLVQGSFSNAIFFNSAMGGNTINNAGTISSLPGVSFYSAFFGSNNADTIINSGTIIGSGTDAIEFEGGDDTLELHSGSTITGFVYGGSGTDTLSFGGVADSAFDLSLLGAAGQYSQFETLTKEGTSTWTLTGTTAETMSLDVNAGTLLANGMMAGIETAVNSGGTLGGSGTVASVGVQSGGTLAPGNLIGTLTVDGNVAFNAGSTYEVEVNAAGQSDLLMASGVVDIAAGASVAVVAFPNYAVGSAYTIITATGGVNDTFDAVTFSLLFVTPTLTYDNNNVYVTLTQTADLKDWAVTPNQLAAAGGVDGLGSGNEVFDAAILLGSTGAALEAFDALSGEGHATMKGVFVDRSGVVRNAMLNRINTYFSAPDGQVAASGYAGAPLLSSDGQGNAFWAQFYGGLGMIRADGNAAASNSSGGGLTVGLDGDLGQWRLGFVAHAGASGLSIPDRSTTIASTDYGFGLYGGTTWGDTGVAFGADYDRHALSTTRQVKFPGFTDTLRAAYGAGTGQVFGELNHEFDLGSLALTPFAQVAYVRHSTDAFTEAGGPAALSSPASVLDRTLTTLGLRGRYEFVVGDDGLGSVTTGAAWRHAFGGTPMASNSFAGGSAFDVSGSPLAGDSLLLQAGLGLDLGSGIALSVAYDGEMALSGQSHAVKAGVSGQF